MCEGAGCGGRKFPLGGSVLQPLLLLRLRNRCAEGLKVTAAHTEQNLCLPMNFSLPPSVHYSLWSHFSSVSSGTCWNSFTHAALPIAKTSSCFLYNLIAAFTSHCCVVNTQRQVCKIELSYIKKTTYSKRGKRECLWSFDFYGSKSLIFDTAHQRYTMLRCVHVYGCVCLMYVCVSFSSALCALVALFICSSAVISSAGFSKLWQLVCVCIPAGECEEKAEPVVVFRGCVNCPPALSLISL